MKIGTLVTLCLFVGKLSAQTPQSLEKTYNQVSDLAHITLTHGITQKESKRLRSLLVELTYNASAYEFTVTKLSLLNDALSQGPNVNTCHDVRDKVYMSSDYILRQFLLEALGDNFRIANEMSQEELMAQIRRAFDPAVVCDPATAVDDMHVFMDIGKPAIPTLISMVGSPSEAVRCKVVSFLTYVFNIEDKRPLPNLDCHLSGDKREQERKQLEVWWEANGKSIRLPKVRPVMDER